MAIAVRRADGTLGDPQAIRDEWKERINEARDYRKQFEPTWLQNFAFSAGKQWQVWHEETKSMRHLSEVEPRFAEADLVVIDKINEHVQAQLGELEADSDRPQMLTAQEGDTGEAIQDELNDLISYGWDYEWNSKSAIRRKDRLVLKLGVSAIRVMFDPTKGPELARIPLDTSGKPAFDEQVQQHLTDHGQMPDGSLPRYKTVHEGKTIWRPISAFGLLSPPGVNHEDDFPYDILVEPVKVDDLVDIYGDVAVGLVEDDDIASIIGTTMAQATKTGSDRTGKGRLRGYVWQFTCFYRPCAKYPRGQVAVLASNQMRLLDVVDELPIKSVTGEYETGLHYFHWWRNEDCFYSRSFVEPMRDPQRIINRREVQKTEIIDRGMPKTFVKEGTLKHNPAGFPLEVIELGADAAEPNFFQGIGPGQWMLEDIAHQADNMAHASTLSPLRLGENPGQVDTYAQLALLNENEQAKRDTILGERKDGHAACVEDSVFFIRKYWPEQKQIRISGDDDRISQATFAKSKIPDFYVIRSAPGSSKPRSQGAELTKIDAIWQAALASGVVATAPQKWIDWYARSLDAGEALQLPGQEADAQVEWARFENFLMLDQGEDAVPVDYDLLPVHVPIHREAQNDARAAGDLQAYQRIEQHIQASIALTQQNAARVAGASAAPSPLVPTPPPAAPQFPPAMPHGLDLAAAGPPDLSGPAGPAGPAGPSLDQGAP